MKTAKEIVAETIKKIEAKQKVQTYEFSQNNDNALSPFELIPIHFTGMIEDYLFRQSGEIYDLLKEDNDQDIEGITYTQIRSDSLKNEYFDKVRLNIPKYYGLKPSERQKHFELEGELYMKKLGVKPDLIGHSKLDQVSNKKEGKTFEPTPMKCAVSKKQALQNKRQEKKNANKVNIKTQLKKDQMSEVKPTQASSTESIEPKEDDSEKFLTPEKKVQDKKKVKFFEFQYVKDFSQYKTPKRLANAEQIIEPLKEQEQEPKV